MNSCSHCAFARGSKPVLLLLDELLLATYPDLRATDNLVVCVGGGASGAATALAYLATWASVLSDGDLATASATPSAGAPSLPSSPAWEWAAAGHVGCDRVSLVAGVYQLVGAPALWMP